MPFLFLFLFLFSLYQSMMNIWFLNSTPRTARSANSTCRPPITPKLPRMRLDQWWKTWERAPTVYFFRHWEEPKKYSFCKNKKKCLVLLDSSRQENRFGLTFRFCSRFDCYCGGAAAAAVLLISAEKSE